MLTTAILVSLSLFPPAWSVQSQANATVGQADSQVNADIAAELANVKRIYVEDFGDSEKAKQLHATMVNALQATKRFIITEDKEKADATLRGAALEQTSQESHHTGESTAVSSGGGDSHVSRAIDDSSSYTETLNEARLAVRLVAKNGDVLWVATEESRGAKYKGAMADVADKVAKKLIADLAAIEKK